MFGSSFLAGDDDHSPDASGSEQGSPEGSGDEDQAEETGSDSGGSDEVRSPCGLLHISHILLCWSSPSLCAKCACLSGPLARSGRGGETDAVSPCLPACLGIPAAASCLAGAPADRKLQPAPCGVMHASGWAVCSVHAPKTPMPAASVTWQENVVLDDWDTKGGSRKDKKKHVPFTYEFDEVSLSWLV